MQCADASNLGGVDLRFKPPFPFERFHNTAVGATNSVAMAYIIESTGTNNDTKRNSIARPYDYAATTVAKMRNGRRMGIDEGPQII
jgi:hypothetical protein